jgi:hypothetical protein
MSLDLSGLGDPASSYATADIALEIIGARKPHRHNKAETPLGGPSLGLQDLISSNKTLYMKLRRSFVLCIVGVFVIVMSHSEGACYIGVIFL